MTNITFKCLSRIWHPVETMFQTSYTRKKDTFAGLEIIWGLGVMGDMDLRGDLILVYALHNMPLKSRFCSTFIGKMFTW